MNSYIVKDGYGIIAFFLILAVIVSLVFHPIWAIVPFGLALFMIYFFRNPKRDIQYDDFALISPADGKVMEIEEFFDEEYLHAPAVKVTIFLSPFDVHVNRAPTKGIVKYQRYTCGGFCPAYKSAASFDNERHAIGIENDKIKVLVIQVAGLLARRIVSWVTLDHELKQGQLYGMIKFGSSTELVMPKGVKVLVKKGERVVGGVTVIGRMED